MIQKTLTWPSHRQLSQVSQKLRSFILASWFLISVFLCISFAYSTLAFINFLWQNMTENTHQSWYNFWISGAHLCFFFFHPFLQISWRGNLIGLTWPGVSTGSPEPGVSGSSMYRVAFYWQCGSLRGCTGTEERWLLQCTPYSPVFP